MPVGIDSTDVEARRIQNWIYAWNSFCSAGGWSCFSEGFEDELIDSLQKQLTHLRQNLTAERNHRTLELYALFIAALALPELEGNDEVLSFAMAALHENFLKDFRADGVHREQSSHYHMTVLRSFLGARENARRLGLFFPDSYDERLVSACEFALHVHRPDGSIPALSDADTGSYLDLLKLAADLFERPDFLYCATSGIEGIAPPSTSVNFPAGGYFIQRSGWGEGPRKFQDERYLIFDCGPLGDGGHGHYDLLTVEISANGKPLVTDPGRFTYAEEHDQRWRHAFKGTAAHNTVCIDGIDQTAYYPGKPKEPVAQGQLLERYTAHQFDMLCGEVRSPRYEVVHTRRIFFIANEYWLIVDSLRGTTPHKYDLRFHLTPEVFNRCAKINNSDNVVIRTPECALIFESSFDPFVEAGWVSPTYGIKHMAPVVNVRSTGQSADFFTLALPQKLGPGLPHLIVDSPRSESVTAGLVQITGVGTNEDEVDEIAWGYHSSVLESPHVGSMGQVAWRRSLSNRLGRKDTER